MLGISNFFQKFKSIDGESKLKISEIIGSIKLVTNIELKSEEIAVNKENIIRINTSPLRRGEVFMNKEKILLSLKEKISK